jgi:hypothetical protein
MTGSYSRANLSMYFLALSFFGLYFYLSRNNPLVAICLVIRRVLRR